jgi:hypothetical protein
MTSDFAAWRREVAAALGRRRIPTGAILERHYRHAFILGRSPDEAADHLATQYVNGLSEKSRMAFFKDEQR